MPKKSGGKLERWEVALVKAMLARGKYNDQAILSYFTRPNRSVNHREISEIRRKLRHSRTRAASDDELDTFLDNWPDVDAKTGLSIKGDELLIKSREAMIAAVHIFNSAGLTFRAELFVVTAIIAWTYLLHAYYRRKGVDYRYYKETKGKRELQRTGYGAEKYWDLARCLGHRRCPVNKATIQNLEFLLQLRHEIEHRSTDRIDSALSAKLQACCINFNAAIASNFGPQFGLEKQLPLALQFVTFNSEQRSLLKGAPLPKNIETLVSEYHGAMTDEELADPEFAYRVAFVQKTANRPGTADEAVEFIKPGSDEEQAVNRVLLKEVEKEKFLPSHIARLMRKEGFGSFSISNHTDLWKALNAKDPNKGYGTQVANQWYWYGSWVKRVREHCSENIDKYSPDA